jgi:hypothetical protein
MPLTPWEESVTGRLPVDCSGVGDATVTITTHLVPIDADRQIGQLETSAKAFFKIALSRGQVTIIS